MNLICGALYVEEHGKNRWTKLFAIPIEYDKLTNLKKSVLPYLGWDVVTNTALSLGF